MFNNTRLLAKVSWCIDLNIPVREATRVRVANLFHYIRIRIQLFQEDLDPAPEAGNAIFP